MAGKATSVHLTVTPKGKLGSVFYKVFFTAKEYNEYVKSEAFIEKYPPTLFDTFKEVY